MVDPIGNLDIQTMPWIAADGLMRKIRRRLENDPAWRMGGVRIENIYKKWNEVYRRYKHGGPRKVMDFGAGMYHPLANIALFFLEYGSEGVAVEYEKSFLPQRAAECLAETLIRGWIETNSEEIDSRIHSFDLKSLLSGIWNDKPNYSMYRYVGDIKTLNDGGFDYVFSQAVLEHVEKGDFCNVISALFEKTTPQGLHAHVIDMRDHRAYSDQNRTVWDFLTEASPGGPYCNRLRKSQILQAFQYCGFEIIEAVASKRRLPGEVRANLLPEYAELSDDDLETHGLRLIAKKP